MAPLTEHFNRQAYADIFLIPLWILLILDICEQREKRRHKRVLGLQREFWIASMKQSRDDYRSQVSVDCPKPQFRAKPPKL